MKNESHICGSEVYRNNGLSVYELDGSSCTGCCRRLTDVAEYLCGCSSNDDIEKSLFYVLYHHDKHKSHLIGFFSKVCLTCCLDYFLLIAFVNLKYLAFDAFLNWLLVIKY